MAEPTHLPDARRRAELAHRTDRIVRDVTGWQASDAPYIHELPERQQRVIRALLDAALAAERSGVARDAR